MRLPNNDPVPNAVAEHNPVRRSTAGQRGCETSAEHSEHSWNDLDAENLLDAVAAHIVRWVVMPSFETVVATALWVVATHLIDEFDTAPRLVVRSPEKRSGKTRLVNEVLKGLVSNPLSAINMSAAYVYRKLNEGVLPTFLVDEADTIFGTKAQAEINEALRGIFNAGYRRGETVGRTSGPTHTPTEYPTFAMVAFAGIGKLPDTIEDRAIVVPMRRRKSSERVETFRHKRDFEILHAMRDRIDEWADAVREQVTGEEPPHMRVTDRAADVWEPLIVVADLVGGRWPDWARAAAMSLTESASSDDQEDNLSTQLLLDIRSVFRGETITSKELVQALKSLDESPWGFDDVDLSSTKLGKRLKNYGIRTRQETSGKRRRLYHRADFADAFERYLSDDPSTTPFTMFRGGSHAL